MVGVDRVLFPTLLPCISDGNGPVGHCWQPQVAGRTFLNPRLNSLSFYWAHSCIYLHYPKKKSNLICRHALHRLEVS